MCLGVGWSPQNGATGMVEAISVAVWLRRILDWSARIFDVVCRTKDNGHYHHSTCTSLWTLFHCSGDLGKSTGLILPAICPLHRINRFDTTHNARRHCASTWLETAIATGHLLARWLVRVVNQSFFGPFLLCVAPIRLRWNSAESYACFVCTCRFTHKRFICFG